MRKIIIFVLFVFMFLFTPCVYAESATDCDITNFSYYVVPSINSSVTIHMQWRTKQPMANLEVKTYSPEDNEYDLSFSMNWDLDDPKFDKDVTFKVKEPKEDAVDKIWRYELAYELDSSSLGTLKIVFNYSSYDKLYQNVLYVQSGIYKDLETQISTKNAILASILATIIAAVGTFFIINASKTKSYDSDEDIINE